MCKILRRTLSKLSLYVYSAKIQKTTHFWEKNSARLPCQNANVPHCAYFTHTRGRGSPDRVARGQMLMCCVQNARNINIFVWLPGREDRWAGWRGICLCAKCLWRAWPGLTLWSTTFDPMIYHVWPYDLPRLTLWSTLAKKKNYFYSVFRKTRFDPMIYHQKRRLTLWSTLSKKKTSFIVFWPRNVWPYDLPLFF